MTKENLKATTKIYHSDFHVKIMSDTSIQKYSCLSFLPFQKANHLQLQVCLKREEEVPEKEWSLNPFNWFTSPKPVTKPGFWSLTGAMNGIPIQIVTSKNCDWMTVLENVLQV